MLLMEWAAGRRPRVSSTITCPWLQKTWSKAMGSRLMLRWVFFLFASFLFVFFLFEISVSPCSVPGLSNGKHLVQGSGRLNLCVTKTAVQGDGLTELTLSTAQLPSLVQEENYSHQPRKNQVTWLTNRVPAGATAGPGYLQRFCTRTHGSTFMGAILPRARMARPA